MTQDQDSFQVVVLLPDAERSIQGKREEHIWDAAFAARGFPCRPSVIRATA